MKQEDEQQKRTVIKSSEVTDLRRIALSNSPHHKIGSNGVDVALTATERITEAEIILKWLIKE